MRRSISPEKIRAVTFLGAMVACQQAGAGEKGSVDADALYYTGLAEMGAGHYETGCKALADSMHLNPRPGTLFTLASCEDRRGRVATAVARFGEYLALYDRLPDDRKEEQTDRPTEARAALQRLLEDLPQLTLSLPTTAPVGTVVKRDGEVLAASTLGTAMPLDPGVHLVSTQAPGGPVWEQRITMTKGEKKRLPLEVKTPARSTHGLAAYVVGGTGITGLIAGGILGGLAVGQKGIINQHCGAGIDAVDARACDSTGLTAANTGKALGLGSTIALATGGAALGASFLLFILAPKPAASATGPRGGWVSAGVLSGGPEGTILGVQGTF